MRLKAVGSSAVGVHHGAVAIICRVALDARRDTD
jgi:hypothetical protein